MAGKGEGIGKQNMRRQTEYVDTIPSPCVDRSHVCGGEKSILYQTRISRVDQTSCLKIPLLLSMLTFRRSKFTASNPMHQEVTTSATNQPVEHCTILTAPSSIMHVRGS